VIMGAASCSTLFKFLKPLPIDCPDGDLQLIFKIMPYI